IKYTPKGGRVEVSATRRPHDEIAIAVRDTGIGIAATDLPHVFDRFWRVGRARSRASERGGFGLGLSISQWIVQAHGGTLSVQARLGRRSGFTGVSLWGARAPPAPACSRSCCLRCPRRLLSRSRMRTVRPPPSSLKRDRATAIGKV